MKRSTLAVLLACAGLSGACSDSQVTSGLAGLSGTYDLTYANGLIFVTSSDRDELRVLDLLTEPKQYIPAPNPLEALSIPVLDRPDALTHDDDFGSSGEAGIPYIYARSSGSQRISVVAAQRDRLTQVGEPLDAGGLVTAFAARAPSATRATSVLYYALQTPPPAAPAGVTYPVNCAFGAIMRRELPGPDILASEGAPPAVPVFCLFERETAMALAVMPEEGRLVVATRNTTRLPPELPGRTLLITETVGGGTPREPVDLSAGFEGSPVRLVATHPQVTLVEDNEETPANETQVLPAGTYIFGLRDESSCGGAPQCTGVLAVESATGVRATDVGGAPMFSITAGTGLPTGMAIIPDGFVLLRVGDGVRVGKVPLLGILPSSNGSITLFSASDRRHFDVEPATANAVVTLRNAAEVVVDRQVDTARETGVVAVEQAVEYVLDPSNPNSRRTTPKRKLFEGSVPDLTFRIIFQGVFPTLAGLPRDLANPTSFEVAQDADPRKQVAPGDVIILESADAVCATDLVIRAVTPTTTGRVRLETSTPIPEICAGLPNFSVLAAGTEPLILVDGAGNLLARDLAGNAAGYGIPTSYFFHPVGFQSGTQLVDDVTGDDPGQTGDEPWAVPAFPKPPPNLVIRVEGNPQARLVRGDRFVVEVNSGVRNYVFGVNTGAGGLALYTLPGPVAAPAGSSLAYIAYPSADGVLQVNMERLVDNALNAAALVPFE